MRRCFTLCGAFTLVAVVGAQPPIFKSGVDAVRVDVSVTRGGRPVSGLAARDFDLHDTGVPQQIEALSLESVPLNLVFTFDTSFSVRGALLQHLKEAAHAAVVSLRPTDRVSFLTFSHVLHRSLHFGGNTAAIDTAIDSLEADGTTALNDAAFAAMELRPEREGRSLVLLFTDGFDTASWLTPLAVIQQARRSDVVVDAAVLEPPSASGPPTRFPARPALPAERRRWFLEDPQLFRQEFLPALVDETGGEIIVVGRSRDLRTTFVNMLSAFRARYTLTFSPKNVAPSGWHPIEVRVPNLKADVRARRGYTR